MLIGLPTICLIILAIHHQERLSRAFDDNTLNNEKEELIPSDVKIDDFFPYMIGVNLKPINSYTMEENLKMVKLHNMYRSNVTPPASNMKYVEYNDTMERLSQEWADNCEFEHGFPPNPFGNLIGQNLYLGPSPMVSRSAYLWDDERNYYDYETGKCNTKMCGHYTQMAWYSSYKLGCGIKLCKKGYLVVCHYLPPGNVIDQRPYVVGVACSQCRINEPNTGEGNWCIDNQCVTKEQCDQNKAKCKCNLKCHNCGILDSTTCTCKCRDGWDSPDCSVPCADDSKYCWKSPGFPDSSACDMNQGRVKYQLCRKMCDQCKGIDKNNLKNTCCEGRICSPGQVLNTVTCRCQRLCPGPICLTVPKEQCDQNKANCKCNLKCHNCGILDSTTCTCKCRDGWDSPDCSVPCADDRKHCGKGTNFSDSSTCDMNQERVKYQLCRKMCGQCKGIDKNNLKNTCCEGRMCSPGQVLNTVTCRCEGMCHGPECPKESSSSSRCSSSRCSYHVVLLLAIGIYFFGTRRFLFPYL